MKKLLLSEVCNPQTNILEAISLINHHVIDDDLVNIEFLADFVDQITETLADIDDSLERAERLLEFLFIDGVFIEQHKAKTKLEEFKLKQGFEFRKLTPSLKILVMRHLIRLAGFESDVVYIPDQFMLRIICDDEFAIIIDVVSGEALSWVDLDRRVEADDDGSGAANVSIISNRSLLLKYLQDLKSTLIDVSRFDKALECTDIMVALMSEKGAARVAKDGSFPYFSQLDVAFDDVNFYLDKKNKHKEDKLLKRRLNAEKTQIIIH